MKSKQQPVYRGHGTYGCVFAPAVSCDLDEGINNTSYASNTVAKVFRVEQEADAEVDIYNDIIQQIDPKHKFTVSLKGDCWVPRSQYKELHECRNWTKDDMQKSLLRQIIYDNGGYDLTAITALVPFETIFMSMGNLFDGIVTMKKHKIAHLDIKPNNIVYHAGRSSMAFVDFGLACSFDQVYKRQYVIGFAYDYYPPEFMVGAEAGQDMTITAPKKHASYYYQNWRSFLTHYNTTTTPVPKNIAYQWFTCTHMSKEKDKFEAFLKVLANQKRPKALLDKLAVFAGKVDVYMLGIVLLQTLTTSLQLRNAHIIHSCIPFYRGVLSLILEMTHPSPMMRASPSQARQFYKQVLKLLPETVARDAGHSATKLSNNSIASPRNTSGRRHIDTKPKQTDCSAFVDDPSVNPRTKRRIKQDGTTYEQLVKECMTANKMIDT